jgi:hypothetical protein
MVAAEARNGVDAYKNVANSILFMVAPFGALGRVVVLSLNLCKHNLRLKSRL